MRQPPPSFAELLRLSAPDIRPHPSLEDDIAVLVAELHSQLRAAVDRELAEVGLDWAGYLTLTVTAAVGGGIGQTALCARTGIDRSTMSQLVRDLTEDGLLERRPHAVDGRKVACDATSAGEELVREGRAAVEAASRRMLRRLSARERRRLAELLAKALGIDRRVMC